MINHLKGKGTTVKHGLMDKNSLLISKDRWKSKHYLALHLSHDCNKPPWNTKFTLKWLLGYLSRGYHQNSPSSHSSTNQIVNPSESVPYLQYTPHLLHASLLLEAISKNHPTNLLHRIWILIFADTNKQSSEMKKGGPTLRQEIGDISYLEWHQEVYQFIKDAG